MIFAGIRFSFQGPRDPGPTNTCRVRRGGLLLTTLTLSGQGLWSFFSFECALRRVEGWTVPGDYRSLPPRAFAFCPEGEAEAIPAPPGCQREFFGGSFFSQVGPSTGYLVDFWGRNLNEIAAKWAE
jgi:hypothetical protein